MISILMPIYNGIEFIDESVSSILNQTYVQWELFIGINGHPENSLIYQMAKAYESKNVKVIDYATNVKGKSNTLNEMVKLCNGEYVALLDVDDIWHSNKLELQAQHLNRYDVIGTRCVYFGDLNGVIPNIPTGDITQYNFALCNPIINSSVLIRKGLCHWNSKWDSIEDYDLWLKLRKSGYTFFNFNEICVRHRIHQTSAFNSKGNHLSVKDLIESYTS